MSEIANGNKGIQAYRWLVTIGMALITALSWRQLTRSTRWLPSSRPYRSK